MPYQTQNTEGTAQVLKKGAADYGSWMQITQAQVNAIKALEGANVASSTDPYAERFAQLVYVVNSSGGSSAGGAITDGVNDTLFATVTDLTNSNPLNTMIVDADGNQIVSFGGGNSGIADGVDDAIVATVSDLANSQALHTLLVDDQGDQITSFGSSAIAESSVPTPVADGENVNPWYDLLGQQVIFGANLALNAIDTNIINDALLLRLGPVTNLSSVVATGAGPSVDVSNYHNLTIHIITSSVTDGGNVDIEHSMDGTNWATVSANTITTDGVTEISMSGVAYIYLRTSVTSRVDGTYLTKIYAGN